MSNDTEDEIVILGELAVVDDSRFTSFNELIMSDGQTEYSVKATSRMGQQYTLSITSTNPNQSTLPSIPMQVGMKDIWNQYKQGVHSTVHRQV